MRFLVGILIVAYPFLLYFGAMRFEAKWLALCLFFMAILRAVASRQSIWWFAAGGTAVLALLSVAGNQILPLKLYPAFINFLLLILFLSSLIWPPSAIERIARASNPSLPPDAISYTRNVTKVWCVFFIANGLTSIWTTYWKSDEAWVFYNGFLAYLLMGVLFAIEYLVRIRVMASKQNA